jgi:predicted alpha/beta hydrolase
MGSGVEELPVRIGEGSALFGVVTRPTNTPQSRAVVLLNAGATTHIGNGRMYVEYARRLAAQGWLVLRYDVSGIGESRVLPGCPENKVYTDQGVPDLSRAVAFLREVPGVRHVEAAGICSGAYYALRGAVEGVALDGITAINPLAFRWREGMSLKYPPFMVAQTTAQYERSMRDWRKWVKVLRGGVDFRSAAAITASRLQERVNVVIRDARRAAGIPVRDDLGSELQEIAMRGTPVRFIFSRGDPGESLLRTGAGSALTPLLRDGSVTVTHLPGCDHNMSMSWMRQMLWREFDRALGASGGALR